MVKDIMTVFLTFFFILSITLIILFIYLSGGTISSGSVDFIAKGKELGLNSKDIRMLKRTADILELEKPLTLLGAINNVDDAILKINAKLQQAEYNDLELIDLLEELHLYRKNIELEKLDKRISITNSRDIPVGQQIKITVGNMEMPILAVVIENNQNFISLELKNETGIKPGVNWKGPINIYFWKKNDAGYYFESSVIETPKFKVWNITHSSNLIRSQKREDLRVDVELNCYVYKLDDISKRDTKSNGFTGTFAQLKNISEGGVAFLINGKIQPGSALKIEFKIDEQVVVLCGLVKDSSYNQSNNISYIRMNIVEPTFEMLSIIRPFLFITSRETFKIKSDKNEKDIENIEEINNNNNRVEDESIKDSEPEMELESAESEESNIDEVDDVEYLP